MFNWIGSKINGAVDAINFLIRAFNKLPAAGIPVITRIPKFARGGFVDGPTVAMLGDNATGREYAVPEEKAIGFANNILSGRRGASAIPAATSTGGGGSGGTAGPVRIDLSIGSVRRDAAGEDWMTVRDGERMIRQAVEQMQRINRTPAGRYVSGTR
jgi:hypothetical protein